MHWMWLALSRRLVFTAGEFAAILNRLFPERTLYLFDTFEGFSNNDLSDEKKAIIPVRLLGIFKILMSTLYWSGWQRRTRLDISRRRQEGLDEDFAFVGLDVDLYKPMAAGLRYFYPRLSNDYNSLRYKGVKTA
jgi:O-methyltransferase